MPALYRTGSLLAVKYKKLNPQSTAAQHGVYVRPDLPKTIGFGITGPAKGLRIPYGSKGLLVLGVRDISAERYYRILWGEHIYWINAQKVQLLRHGTID